MRSLHVLYISPKPEGRGKWPHSAHRGCVEGVQAAKHLQQGPEHPGEVAVQDVPTSGPRYGLCSSQGAARGHALHSAADHMHVVEQLPPRLSPLNLPQALHSGIFTYCLVC